MGEGEARQSCDSTHFDHLGLRKASVEDLQMTYVWRNHPSVRQYSNDPAEISLQSHARWFNSVLSDDKRDLLIAICNDMPVGVIRFDQVAAAIVRVSIYLNPCYMHKGLGPRVLRAGEQWLILHRPRIESINATIKSSNDASIRCFTKAGYYPAGDEYVRKVGGSDR